MSNRNNKPRVFIIGVGMTKFEKPGKRDWDYPDVSGYLSLGLFWGR